ncbi:MAG: bifunctional oligoribonuclease/PAP phosphatase NrnA [Spirochaetales bacterium]|nr:bifunctional oligoribonuclease/PAP phosphatase NrnA [Spirochaetales bacterium]
MITEIPQELINFINNYETFFVIGHTEPDGDCIGSQKALASFLRRIDKQAELCSAGPFIREEIMDEKQFFINSIKKADKDMTNAAAIIVDCSTPERIGELLSAEIEKLPTAVIDHHASGKDFGDVTFINSTSPSATVLVYQLMKTFNVEPTEKEAEDLLFGFLTDTGYFRHLDKSQSDFMQLASELIAYGVSLKDMYYRMYGGKSVESRLLTGKILSRIEPLFDKRCFLIYQTLSEKEEFGSKNRDSDTIYNQVLSIKGCEAVIFIREESDSKVSVSLRSRDKIDVGKIAASFGGGGHKNAAGFECSENRSSIEFKIKEAFSQVF